MPRASGISVQNNFSKGLITEATGLNFPEQAFTESNNVVVNNTGSVSRRLGLDFEHNYEESIQSVEQNCLATYVWKNASDEGDITFVVVQNGDIVYFYRVLSDLPLSSGKHAFTIDLRDYIIDGTTVRNLECQFASGNGFLFMANQRTNTIKVGYDSELDSFNVEYLDVIVRDLEGDPLDSSAEDERISGPVADLPGPRRYNLENQGWTSDTLAQWDAARSDTPSNCDVSWYYKDENNNFDFTRVDQVATGNSPAAKGHFKFVLWSNNRDFWAPGATPRFIEDVRMTTVAWFAGRLFYAGMKYPTEGSRIYFTQIIERAEQYERCYQINDPTSETQFDLLPSDGGFIDLIEAGTILWMRPVLNTLIVWATNGIWAISGSQGIGFTATDYVVSRLSTVSQVSHKSLVDVEGQPYWWNLDGIYTLERDQNGSVQVKCITDTTIRTAFRAISGDAKNLARGAYDSTDKKIYWLYRDGVANTFTDKYTFNRILVYNLITGAFFIWSNDSDLVKIHSIISVSGSSGGTIERYQVVNSGDTVVSDGDPVVVFQSRSGESVNTVVKFFVSFPDLIDGTTRVTFAECYQPTYYDWKGYNQVGAQYESYFVTGYTLRGEGARKFQENYINVFTRAYPDVDACWLIRGQWNYANDPNTGKWSTSQMYTIPMGNFDYIRKRPKIRGHGHTCQIRFDGFEDCPFEIIGWSAFETGNKSV